MTTEKDYKNNVKMQVKMSPSEQISEGHEDGPNSSNSENLNEDDTERYACTKSIETNSVVKF